MNDPATTPSSNARCSVCATPFHCGCDDVAPCWCGRDFPMVAPVPAADSPARCLCPTCLAAYLAGREQPGAG